jgi:hypothetical protein
LRALDGNTLSNASSNSATFQLLGGLYGITATATWSSGSVTLEMLGPDGSTFVTAATAFSANGYETAYLPPGTYKWVIATATAVYARVTRIPFE